MMNEKAQIIEAKSSSYDATLMEVHGVEIYVGKCNLQQRVRRIAFASIVCATVACAALVVALPMLYNNILLLHAEYEHDVRFCTVERLFSLKR